MRPELEESVALVLVEFFKIEDVLVVINSQRSCSARSKAARA
jgi:hypothetical protein